MTKEEAIKAVKEVAGMSLPWDDRHYEALQIAIGVLEQSEYAGELPDKKRMAWEKWDSVWASLSKIYNMPDVSNDIREIIGDIMLRLPAPYKDGENDG